MEVAGGVPTADQPRASQGGCPATRVLLGSVTVGVESICKESGLSRAPRVHGAAQERCSSQTISPLVIQQTFRLGLSRACQSAPWGPGSQEAPVGLVCPWIWGGGDGRGCAPQPLAPTWATVWSMKRPVSPHTPRGMARSCPAPLRWTHQENGGWQAGWAQPWARDGRMSGGWLQSRLLPPPRLTPLRQQ